MAKPITRKPIIHPAIALRCSKKVRSTAPVLSATAPQLVAAASALPIGEWIDVATGRMAASGPLAAAAPVMA